MDLQGKSKKPSNTMSVEAVGQKGKWCPVVGRCVAKINLH